MAQFLDQLIHFVAAQPMLAYAAVFLAALLEAVPVVGAVIPGSSLIIAMSALVGAGDLGLPGVLIGAITGAAIGDGTAFAVGHVQKRHILGVWPLKLYPTLIARSEEFFEARGAIAVLLARFVPPVRAFVPVTAGALGMPPVRFFAISIPAICLWACVHVLPGALAGSLWKQYGREVEHSVLPMLVVAAVIWLIVWIVRRRRIVPG